MPTASQVSAQDINSEIGYTSTQSVNLNETRVRNLACDSSGEINFAQCRWGINFPGGAHALGARTKQYDTTSSLDLYDNALIGYDGVSTVTASVSLYLNSGGTMVVYTPGGVTNTWLTSGSAGDYYAQLSKTSGTDPTGSAINTDLVLSTTRYWEWTVTVGPGYGYNTKSFSGNLIIKDSGTLITRPFTVEIIAEVS